MKIDPERLILYVNAFLLALVIGINSHTLYVWLNAPPEREYCTR